MVFGDAGHFAIEFGTEILLQLLLLVGHLGGVLFELRFALVYLVFELVSREFDLEFELLDKLIQVDDSVLQPKGLCLDLSQFLLAFASFLVDPRELLLRRLCITAGLLLKLFYLSS